MQIELKSLLWMLIPTFVVVYFYIKNTKDIKTPFLAIFRMIIQLLLIGYLLVYIFNANSPFYVAIVLFVMLFLLLLYHLDRLKKKV